MSRKNVWERYESDDSDDPVYSDDDEPHPISLSVSHRTHTVIAPITRTVTAAELEARKYECIHCRAHFKSKKELRSHKLKNTEDHEYCPECDRDFETHSDMQMHLIKSPLHIVCVDCFKQFKSNGGLEGHRRQMHRNSQKLHCPGCGAVFLNASGITQHVEGNGCQAGLNKAVLSRKIIHSNDPTASLDIDPRRKPNTTTTHIWRDGIIPPELKKHVNNSYSLQFPEDDAARLRRDARATARKTEPVMPDWHNNQVNPAASVKSDSTERTTLNRNKPSVLDYTDGIGAFEDENEPTLHDMGRYWAAKERHFLCPYNQCRKRFFNANAILQHMLSSTHARKVFRCPTCCDRYRSASALLQHMESGSCGISETAHALDVTNSLTGGIIFEAM